MKTIRVFFITSFIALGACSSNISTGLLAVASPSTAPTPNQYASLPLPIQNQPFVMTFHDEFTSLATISSAGTFNGANWYNGTEQCCMQDSTGLTGVMYPAAVSGVSVNPYSLNGSGGLNITLSKQSNNVWYSGVMTSVDSAGTGFRQQYGYFEMKAQMPAGDGTWPGFWLLSTDPNMAGEIDVMESYGHDLGTKFAITLHDWRSGLGDADIPTPQYFPTVSGMNSAFHTYGLLWTSSQMTFYFDGLQVWSHATPDVMQQPYSLLADLGVGGGWPTTATPSTNVMQIAYIRSYQSIPPALDVNVHKQVFGYTGRDQTFSVPAGVTSFRVQAWGAGGAGGAGDYGYTGGGGGYASATIAVTSPIYNVVVGQHGSYQGATKTYGGGGISHGNSGSGGGRSAVQLAGFDILTAGGGGGSGYGGSNEAGGGGGGVAGGGGSSYAGQGGTATAGGVGGNPGNGTATGSSGQMRNGGDCDTYGGWSGGGGGGYYGGGGGGETSSHGGAGGGGSSLVTGTNLTNGVTTPGANATPGNNTDANYVTGTAFGGAKTGPGGDGLVIMTW